MKSKSSLLLAAGFGLALFACKTDVATSPLTSAPSISVNMSFARASFFDAPVPSDDLVGADGVANVHAWPLPDGVDLGRQLVSMIATDTHGFSQSAGIFFTLSAPIDPSALPDLAGSMRPDAPVFLVAIDGPDAGKRTPVTVSFEADPGPFGAPNMLSLIPLQGLPLAPHATYAAVVRRSLKGADGAPMVPSPALSALLGGTAPAGMSTGAYATYRKAIAAIEAGGTAAADIGGIAAFTTGDATAEFDLVKADILAQPTPKPAAPFAKTDTFDGFCVYQTTVSMPDYQAGTPPFQQTGGNWAFDASGKPIVQRHETARIVVTVPRAPMPAGGWPTGIFIRTGAGGDRPLVDRGVQAMTGGPPIAPGTGPARWFAMAGWAGVQIDGPHGGPFRNPTGGDEDFLMFNVNNITALRDNVRESAVELVLFSHMLPSLGFSSSDCAGSSATVAFDTSKLALFGHSMGATIAPLVLAKEPSLRLGILSGSGSSWMENVIHKHAPVDVQPLVELLLGYTGVRTLSEHDPVLSLFQWAAESADPMLYDRAIIAAPEGGAPARNILMFQGIVDHYIEPAIANATTLSLGLDVGGTPLDASNAELMMAGEPTIASVLPYSGRSVITLPVTGNLGASASKVTGAVVQHAADGIEDGHEVAFQTASPKQQYRCFLQSFAATGRATIVPSGGGADDPCPM